ncbi:tRNA (adenosine(37)-N6)-dimethylallyltransferase MiaA [Solitalea lacus]|uniref:tRNA (adenosine(37)-N6)-dimethylallyltransferase MiaA n=1 Tax=Solitalea lacus TaxID=2911172 RepID=UPI001EDA2668|nr:tRNA (adenosine(37)-N6)-dimethylallyltransferase MiaA [Solitalea lacus]UKJ06095.1 tRNA (adenosine(37)-N6)-dimethylallyltransferase MiaA [Solitalea lacus]
MNKPDLVVILGPTASGKTRLAVRLAHELKSAVISGDSRQVYKDMNIGTGKDLNEYTYNGQPIPYYLIDIKDAGERYNISEFQRDFSTVYQQLHSVGKLSVLCGGTGLYIESILKDFQYTSIPVNEALRARLISKSKEELLAIHQQTPSAYSALADISTSKRLIRAIEIGTYLQSNEHKNEPNAKINTILFGIDVSRDVRRQRISTRLEQRLNSGMIEEVKDLLNKGISVEDIIYYGLEYKFITLYLLGELSYDELSNRLENAICQFAKRQMTYFRKMERDGFTINWINGELPIDEQLKVLLSHL